ncbi:MAG: L-threonylcarbamoyladenylate synthase [Desulfobacterota bacterium]|nr:L-threonylcarbamoyladenylate synthase [Thermodesulfobacteriota bacterium]MDW8001640.1 L-threonylcarbamoyladenylate synthase [Deltaproteobacteria bacterium]
MQILKGDDYSAFQIACDLLKKGEIVAFPTETVYGLGADALNPHAVLKIFEVKRRPRFDPIIVHVSDYEWVRQIVKGFPEEAKRIAERFWPGPLTIILEKNEKIPDIVTAGLSTVAVRMPSHPIAKRLIESFGRPIAAPSANPFGYISPTKASHVAKLLGNRIPLIIDGGDTVFGIESTVISVEGQRITVYRLGAIAIEELSEFGEIVFAHSGTEKYRSPGQLPYHYAPHKPLKIVDGPEMVENPLSSYLAFKEPEKKVNAKYIRVLSKTGDLKEAAFNFFSYLLELDRDDVEIIYAEKIPEVGLGRAMMERLKKAEKKHLLT